MGLSAALALHDGHGRGGFTLWPLFGAADLVLAVLGFALLALALRRLERPVAAVILPMVFLLIVVNWALFMLLLQWWSTGDWILITLAIILILTELGVTLLALNMLKSSPRSQT